MKTRCWSRSVVRIAIGRRGSTVQIYRIDIDDISSIFGREMRITVSAGPCIQLSNDISAMFSNAYYTLQTFSQSVSRDFVGRAVRILSGGISRHRCRCCVARTHARREPPKALHHTHTAVRRSYGVTVINR